MTDDVIAPKYAARIVDAQPLKMAVTYIWSEVCVRNSTPIWRDRSAEPSRAMHGASPGVAAVMIAR